MYSITKSSRADNRDFEEGIRRFEASHCTNQPLNVERFSLGGLLRRDLYLLFLFLFDVSRLFSEVKKTTWKTGEHLIQFKPGYFNLHNITSH